jgi:hypothetical protein
MRSTPIEGALPPEFSLLLGETLYQLRAALDNVIYDAAILDSGQNPPPNPKDLEFPVCAKRTWFDELAFKLGPLSKNRKALIEAVQPYNTPKLAPELMVYNYNRTLGILSDWARKDRHRKLNVLRSWAVEASPKLRLPPGVTLQSLKVRAWGFLEDKDEIASFKLKGFVPGMKVQGNPDVSFDIAVDEVPAPCHESDTLGNRLEAMVRAVAFIAGKIERDSGPELS